MVENGAVSDAKSKENIDTWGYAVCFGIIVTFVAGIGHVNSFGLIYNDFIIETHSSTKSLTTAHGVFAMMLAVGGLILNIISKRFSLRVGGLFGCIMFVAGSFCTILISSMKQLIFTFGILQGMGFGMMAPVCYATLNSYFIQRRTTVMSICKAVQGLILIVYPQLIKQIMSNYGMRGTLLIISGVSLHSVAGILVMQTHRRIKTARSLEGGDGPKENGKLLHTGNDEVPSNDNVTQESPWLKHKRQVINLLNLKALKDPIYCNICFGQSFVNFSDLTFFVLQPMLLFQYGFNKGQVATCISLSAGADVLGRFALALVSSATPINTRLLFYVTTLFTLLFRIVLLQLHDFAQVAAVTAALGFLRAWLHVASPLIVSSHVTSEEFPAAYATFMLISGVINVTFGPFIGYLKDLYEDYTPAFYALSLCCTPCLLFWSIEYALIKNKL